MKKIDWNKWKLQKVEVSELGDRALLINLYLTQLITLILGVVIILLQGRNPISLLSLPEGSAPWLWGAGFAAVVLAVDILISRWVPEEVNDDGGINRLLFRNRAVWHIIVLSFVVSICEEMLFRGAIQHAFGPYWTSILFALIHIRYLRHWLMTGLVFSISYGLGWVYMQTGTLWTPIFAHFVIDAAMGMFIRFKKEEDEEG